MESVPSRPHAQGPIPPFDTIVPAGTETTQALREALQLLLAIAINQCSGEMEGVRLRGSSHGSPLWAWLLRHLVREGRFRVTRQDAMGRVQGYFLFGGEEMDQAEAPPRRRGSALRSAEVSGRKRKADK
jgi:hypothetical protein